MLIVRFKKQIFKNLSFLSKFYRRTVLSTQYLVTVFRNHLPWSHYWLPCCSFPGHPSVFTTFFLLTPNTTSSKPQIFSSPSWALYLLITPRFCRFSSSSTNTPKSGSFTWNDLEKKTKQTTTFHLLTAPRYRSG